MIRGAIELATPSRLQGWIWSSSVTLAGRTLLAFLDETCVGTGRVDIPRQDLRDAGLGDGLAGFSLPVACADARNAPRIVVRLEGSDFVLVQRKARVAAGVGPFATAHLSSADDARAMLEWMRSSGWICQAEHDFLRFFIRFGAYQRSLVMPAVSRGSSGLEDASRTATSLLDLHRGAMLVLQRAEAGAARRGADDRPRRETLPIQALARRMPEIAAIGVNAVCLWARQPGKLAVVEGSHRQSEMSSPFDAAAKSTYRFGSDRLLFLDPRIAVSPEGIPVDSEIDVLFLE